jgi:hypothetical protein
MLVVNIMRLLTGPQDGTYSSVLEVVNAAKEVLKIILVKEKVMVKMKIYE